MDGMIGDTIKAARIKMGMARDKLALLVGVSITSIRDWERNRYTVSTPNISRLAAALGLNESDLLETQSVCHKRGRNGPLREAVPPPPVVVPEIQKLCGDCFSWKSRGMREGIYRMGRCEVLGITTERCEWCRKKAI